MAEWLESIEVFPVVLTLFAFWVGRVIQKKWKSQLLNPILIGSVLVIGFLLLTGMDPAAYKAGTAKLSWLMTPATVAFAIPMYEQLQVLKKNGKAIAVERLPARSAARQFWRLPVLCWGWTGSL